MHHKFWKTTDANLDYCTQHNYFPWLKEQKKSNQNNKKEKNNTFHGKGR